MFNWKIVATIFITLGILVAFLSTSPQLGNFFDALREKLYSIVPEQKVERNISFSLAADATNISAQARDINIRLETNNFTAQLKDVSVSSKGRIRILGFFGLLSINSRNLALDGSFKKVELEDTTLTLPQGTIKSQSAFASLAIDNLAMKELVVPKGKLTVNNVETDSANEIRIFSPLGRFEVDSKLQVTGKANKISIPEAKIFIG